MSWGQALLGNQVGKENRLNADRVLSSFVSFFLEINSLTGGNKFHAKISTLRPAQSICSRPALDQHR